MKSITRFTGNLHGKKCLNCEKEISEEDNFCAKCGQVNDLNRLSVKQYFSEYLNGFYSFDNRFLRTVIPLLFKPGQVSKNYVEGKRIYYVNPFQLYLHITLLFFLIVGIFKTVDSFKPDANKPASIIAEINEEKDKVDLDSLKEETLKELRDPDTGLDSASVSLIATGLDQVAKVAKEKSDSIQPKDYTEEEKQKRMIVMTYVDSLLQDSVRLAPLISRESKVREQDSVMSSLMNDLESKINGLISPNEEINIKGWEQAGEAWGKVGEKFGLKKMAADSIQAFLTTRGSDYTIPKRMINPNELNLPDNKIGQLIGKVNVFMDYQKENPKVNVTQALEEMGYELSYWNVFYYNKAGDWNRAKDNPEFLDEWIDRILSRVSVALFFLLPVFTLIVSLLYIRRKYNYTENLVFVFHVQTVFFILLLIFMVLGRIVNSSAIPWIFLILFMIYLYKAMRNFYEQGRLKTFVKYCILNFSFLILASFGAVIVSFLAFLI